MLKTKSIKTMIGVVILALFVLSFGYANLLVSERYETDEVLVRLSDASDSEKQARMHAMQIRAQEIETQKSFFWLALITSAVLLLILLVLFVFGFAYK